jgi:hypothetical protein
MAARGCLVGLLGVVAGLALLGDLADVGTRHLATSKIEQRIGQSVPEASGVRARIRSWPFLKVAVDGHVDEIDAHVSKVLVKPLVFSDVGVELRGVRVSVADMVTDARVDVTHIARGTITLTVTEGDIERALVALVPGGVRPPSAAVSTNVLSHVVVSVDPVARRLVLAAPGFAKVSLALPGADLLPCIPAVAQAAASITLSCTFDHVPSAFTSLTS